MLGVVIGIGEGWDECATRAAACMASCTGVECHAVCEWPGLPLLHPAWLKCWMHELFPGVDLMLFDADLVPLVRWDPVAALGDYDAAGAPDEDSTAVREECARHGLEPDRYFNSGLVLVRAGSSLLPRAQGLYPCFGSWLEQTALNYSARNLRLRLLDRRLNVLHWPGAVDPAARSPGAAVYDRLVNPHMAGAGSNVEDRLRLITRLQALALGGAACDEG